MLEWTFKQIKELSRTHPVVFIVICAIIVVGTMKYYALASEKADIEDVKKIKEDLDDVKEDVSDLKGEFRGLARFLKGTDSFLEKPSKLPPQEYLIGVADSMLEKKYDSCRRSVVIDTATNRHVWYCWHGEEIYVFE